MYGNFANFGFSIMKKLWDLKKVFSNLELEGQGRGIIMGVTRLLLLEPFYYIQTNFLYFFAHDCSVGILSVNWPRRPASYSVLFPLEKPLIWEMTFINVSSSNFSWRWFLARCGDHICSIWLPPAELGRIGASQEGWRGAQWFQRAKIRRKWVHFREFFRVIC